MGKSRWDEALADPTTRSSEIASALADAAYALEAAGIALRTAAVALLDGAEVPIEVEEKEERRGGARVKADRSAIRAWIYERKEFRTAELAEAFEVTEQAARNWLAELEARGTVERSRRGPHGAALWTLVKPIGNGAPRPRGEEIAERTPSEPVPGTGRPARAPSGEIDEMLRSIGSQARWERDGAGHIAVTALATGERTTLPSTPRTDAAIRNAKARLRGIGIRI